MYRFWYWPGIPGRGEFVRLALEAGQIAYRDCAQDGDDITQDLKLERADLPFAPPYLIARKHTIAQTANILLFLGDSHGLSAESTSGRLWVNQVQLTIADAVAEAHNVHHPVDPGAYYEDQRTAALACAAAFRATRLPKYLTWFETVLERKGNWVNGNQRWSYADLSLFQLIEGLCFAFPRRMATLAQRAPRVMALRERVRALPPLAGYFKSGRRQNFSDGIFRHYPELDGD